jgi:hypothetical protein
MHVTLNSYVGRNHQLPVASSTILNKWREEVVMYNHNKYMELLSTIPFVLLGDGSHRSGEHEFPLLSNYFHHGSQKHVYKIIGIIDLATDGTALNMSQHIHQLIQQHQIPFNNIIAMVTDNTNSMSGQYGGAVVLLSEACQQPIARIPCAMHVLHLCINKGQDQVQFILFRTCNTYTFVC